MIRRDYHGFTLAQALEDAESTIASVRMNRAHQTSTEDAEFVVGHGVIRNELISLLESYGLIPTQQLGNAGVIVCVIE